MAVGEIAKKVGCTPALVYNVKARVGGAGGAPKRGPGRPPKAKSTAVAGTAVDGLGGILDAVRNSERERAGMRAALEKIQAVIASALA
jgi:hypothetical protein